MVVASVSRSAPSAVAVKRGGEKGVFGVKPGRAERTDAAVPTAGVAMISLLAMQEAESDAQQDREARQHGEAVIDELVALQRALLGIGGAETGRLADLLTRPVAAADPHLAGLLRAVRLRAGIELARRERSASQ